MYLRIFHRNVYLLLLVLTLLVCFGVGTSDGNANALAQKVYTKHRTVLARADVQAALPAMLEQLGTLAVQKLLTPASILLAVENPELLKPVVPDASPEFIAAMKEDAGLQKLLQDADFQELLQTPAAIDVLVTLIRGADGPTLTLDGVRIQAFTSALELPMRRFELTSESFTIGDTFQIDTTHNFVFTATSANGDPVPWLPIRFNAVYVDGTAAALTFAPATAKTNQNGTVRTNITFRGDPGNIRLIAAVDRSQLVAFLAPQLVRNGSSVADVEIRGIEQGFAGLGTKRTLVFTATDENTDPISGIALTFGFQSDAARQATATFLPATATTDENGRVQTRVTFGTTPGDLRIEVNVTPDAYFYWTGGTSIERANADGSNHTVVLQRSNAIFGLALDAVRGHLYWVESLSATREERILRANIDGSNPTDIVTGFTNPISDFALDVVGGKLYWSHHHPTDGDLVVQRANVDGSNIETIFTDKSAWALDNLAVDPVRRKIYWVRSTRRNNRLNAEIQRMNLDGSNLETVINPNLSVVDGQVTSITDIALDVERGQIYYFQVQRNAPYRLRSANLDGGNIQDLSEIRITPYIGAFALDSASRKIYWMSDDFYSADLSGTTIETIRPYWRRNGSTSTTTVRGARGLALNTTIDPSRIQAPPVAENVRIRDTAVTLTPSAPNAPDIVVKIAEGNLSGGFPVGSRHKLTFSCVGTSGEPLSAAAIVDALQGIGYQPVLTTQPDGTATPQLQLKLSPRSSTTATFQPSTLRLDENGRAETFVTFGAKGGVIDIDVLLPVVEFESVITDISIEDLASNGRMSLERVEIDNDDSTPGGHQKFVFTATDPNTRQPLSGYPLELRVDPTSSATATLNPSQIEFDENGKAEIQIINGPQGGHLKIIATLKRLPLYLKALNYILSDEVDPDVEVTMFGGLTKSPIEVGDELRSRFQTETDFLNVHFDVKKNGISMSGVELVLTATSDKPSVTFRPSTIDITHSISTVMTVGKDVRELSIEIKVKLQDHLRIKALGKSIGDYAITYNIAGSEIAVGQQYPVGSKHKVMITLTKDGEAVPDATITPIATSLSVLERIASKSMPTATFDPAEVITDENGEAETYLTFGDVPGDLDLDFDFDVDIPKITYTGADSGVTFSLISHEDADKTDDVDWSDLNTWTSIPFGESRPVRVEALYRGEERMPNVDLILSVDNDSQKSATFRGKTQLHKQVSERGTSFFTITFGEQRGDIHIDIELNMVYALVDIYPDEEDTHPLINHGYTYYRHFIAGTQQPDIETDTAVFDEEGIQRSDTLVSHRDGVSHFENRIMRSGSLQSGYVDYDPTYSASRSYDRVFLYLPLGTSNALDFDIHEMERALFGPGTAKVKMVPDGSIYTLWEKRGLESFQLHNDYAISEDGRFSFRFDTGSTPGEVSLVFGPPVGGAMLKGKITVFAENDEPLGTVPVKDEVDIGPNIIFSQRNFTPSSTATFRHKDIRLEVYIKTRRIKTSGVEIGAYVKFFEFNQFVGGENDLDGVSFLTFTLPWKTPWPHRRLLHIGQLRDRKSDYNHSLKRLADDSLLPPLIDVDASAQRSLISPESSKGESLMGLEDLRRQVTPERGNDDWANVYLDLEVTPREFTPVFAAPSARTTSPFSFSDVNVDGQVNVTDLMLVSNALEQTDLTSLHMDVNSDGTFTIADLMQVAAHLGESIGSQTPAALVVPEQLTYPTVEAWIDQARAADDGSRLFKHGIANLQRLLTRIIPEDTALLSNYPNPSNPETWIPYHLAKPAQVTLTIYSIDGKVVRRLDLGHQAAGYYQSRSRAAYWDGRNAVGERVATGLYFYTLTTDDFAATGKMLILK